MLTLVFGVCASAQWSLSRVAPRRRRLLGVVGLLVASSGLAVAGVLAATWLLVVAGVLAGVAHGAAFSGSVALVARRGGRAVATVLLWSYVGNALPALGIGALAPMTGLPSAVVAFALVLAAALGLLLLLLARERAF